MQNKKNSQGFTIVELLIVVAIIGILAAVAVPAYFNHILRTRQAEAYHNLLDIKAAEEIFYSQYNRYGTPFADGNTFSALLSFDIGDSTYYSYLISGSTLTNTFNAEAQGKATMKKLAGYKLKITDDADPCIDIPSGVDKPLTLGLKPCP
jgi:type IV pilus assembly protein PilE